MLITLKDKLASPCLLWQIINPLKGKKIINYYLKALSSGWMGVLIKLLRRLSHRNRHSRLVWKFWVVKSERALIRVGNMNRILRWCLCCRRSTVDRTHIITKLRRPIKLIMVILSSKNVRVFGGLTLEHLSERRREVTLISVECTWRYGKLDWFDFY
jgi:hypothetical protein